MFRFLRVTSPHHALVVAYCTIQSPQPVSCSSYQDMREEQSGRPRVWEPRHQTMRKALSDHVGSAINRRALWHTPRSPGSTANDDQTSWSRHTHREMTTHSAWRERSRSQGVSYRAERFRLEQSPLRWGMRCARLSLSDTVMLPTHQHSRVFIPRGT